MKIALSLLFFINSYCSFANTDSLTMAKKPWTFHGFMMLTNNGISPVPAFSLGKAASMNTFFINKGRFSYSPEFNFALNAKPWVVNQWLRYRINHKSISYQTGINLSLFFINNKNTEIQELSRYLAYEGLISKAFNKNTSLTFATWLSKGLDVNSIKNGIFMSLNASFEHIKLGKKLDLGLRPNLFYLENKAPFKGTFISMMATLTPSKSPIGIFGQYVQPLKSEPKSKSNQNFGILFRF
jgi:hypothetical protein